MPPNQPNAIANAKPQQREFIAPETATSMVRAALHTSPFALTLSEHGGGGGFVLTFSDGSEFDVTIRPTRTSPHYSMPLPWPARIS